MNIPHPWIDIPCRVLAIALVGLLQGCGSPFLLSIQCGKLQTRAEFSDVWLLDGGETGLFSASKTYVYPCEYCAACNEQIAHRDRQLVGTYTLASHHVTVLHRFNRRNPKGFDGYWSIQSVQGSTALLAEVRRSLNHETNRTTEPIVHHHLLNTLTGDRVAIPLGAELTAQGLLRTGATPGPQLLTDAGDLLVPLPVLERLTLNTTEYDYWVRHADGDWMHLGVTGIPFVVEGRIYLWRSTTSQPVAYDLDARTLTPVPADIYQTVAQQESVSAAAPSPHLTLNGDTSPTIYLGRWQSETWHYTPLPVEAADLDW